MTIFFCKIKGRPIGSPLFITRLSFPDSISKYPWWRSYGSG